MTNHGSSSKNDVITSDVVSVSSITDTAPISNQTAWLRSLQWARFS